MFVEKVCQLSPFPPRLLVLFILLILPQPSRQPSSTGLSLHQAGARRDHRRADLTKLLERPAYTCCLPSSPPIPSSAHCLLTRSTPWKGSHQGSQCPHKPLLESPCPAEHPPVPPPVGLASGLRTDMCPVPETPRDQALSLHFTGEQPAATWAVAWLGQLKSCRWKRRKSPRWDRPPRTQVFFLADLLPSSWFGPTPSPGFLRGTGPRMWDPSPLQLEIGRLGWKCPVSWGPFKGPRRKRRPGEQPSKWASSSNDLRSPPRNVWKT
ncbi:uncharacterized protein LOC101052317 isoform X1 [Saimiri boliviensis]|uniref:uncharacterized protein LOC101052317 isoform X1 n=1 Tax=Saimiri boliviensis TaxID=27679 RepID=UPI003D7815BA